VVTRIVLAAAALAAFVTAAACFTIAPANGSIECAPDGECPANYTCVAKRCWSHTPTVDGGGDGGFVDGGRD
jgi:hypothetical protein